MAYHQLETLHQLHDGYMRAFSVAGLKLLLVQEANPMSGSWNRI